jgi:hypothetical protein
MTAPAAFWSAPSFRVLFHYSRSETTADVLTDGKPVARLTKAGPPASAQPFHLTVADAPAGIIGGPIAYGPDGTQLGRVHSRGGGLGKRRWSVEQPGLGTLTAKAVGVSGLRYRWPQSIVLASSPANSVLPFAFHFKDAGSTGFTIRRRAGVRAEFDVDIHDERVDRRVVLAAVLGLARDESNDLRSEIADITGNPFRP